MVTGLFRRRRVSGAPREPGPTATITLRLATPEDAEAIERLAALYDRPPLTGPTLLAVVDGELQAALTLAGDRELMEPFLPTAGLVDLLAWRAKQLREQPAPRPLRPPRGTGDEDQRYCPAMSTTERA
jgi:hypothetical protein